MTTLKDLQNIPHIDHTQITPLWHGDYYDGPLSGMVSYQGKKCWAALYKEFDRSVGEGDDAEFTRVRLFALIELPANVVSQLEQNHALFQKYVGNHCDYGPDRKRELGALRPPELHHLYYDNPPEDPNTDKYPVIGFFKDW